MKRLVWLLLLCLGIKGVSAFSAPAGALIGLGALKAGKTLCQVSLFITYRCPGTRRMTMACTKGNDKGMRVTAGACRSEVAVFRSSSPTCGPCMLRARGAGCVCVCVRCERHEEFLHRDILTLISLHHSTHSGVGRRTLLVSTLLIVAGMYNT
jgi:hypothetical protein